MPNYKESFKKRNTINTAEEKCVEYLQKNNILFTRYGFDCLHNVSAKDFIKIPENLRSTPDYMVFRDSAFFLEAKGCFDLLKLKLSDLKAYNFWNNLCKLYVFSYSTKFKEKKIVALDIITEIVATCKIDYYEDNGKAYYKIPWEKI